MPEILFVEENNIAYGVRWRARRREGFLPRRQWRCFGDQEVGKASRNRFLGYRLRAKGHPGVYANIGDKEIYDFIESELKQVAVVSSSEESVV